MVNLERKYEWTLLILPPPQQGEPEAPYATRVLQHLEGRLDDRPEDKGVPQPGGIAVLIGQAAKVSERAKENGKVDLLASEFFVWLGGIFSRSLVIVRFGGPC